MFKKLLLIFIILPILEMTILIKMGEIIGVFPTILLVIATGVIGVNLARIQGFRVLAKIRGNLRDGIMPGNELIEGLLIFAGGLLLLTPGLITDTIGFLALLPGSRTYMRELIKKYFKFYLQNKAFRIYFR